ncbi:hypothetical protein P3S67_019047 [Capsicum chacoense]
MELRRNNSKEINKTVLEQFNGTVHANKVTDKMQQREATSIWSEVVTRSTSMLLEASSSASYKLEYVLHHRLEIGR